ncbi:MAG: aspartate aminotransferase family protein [Chloroflexota bacterium]|nr:aspartate aminotransferase family protein [Chloroflexota bacterium]
MPGAIEQEYIKQHQKSAELYRRAEQDFPGGVTHDTRYVTPFPIYVTHASGPRKWDVDGNEYVDYVMGHGSLLLGHCHPAIVAAVTQQVTRSTHPGASTELEIRWADAVKRLAPSVEKVRFHSSGTEATLMAMRLARAFTGKSKILKFHEHFHGWHDYATFGMGRPSPGVPAGALQSMLALEPGDILAVERVLQTDNDIAAVILEPTGAHMGALPVQPAFCHQLREVTQRYGVLLIFDEVVTGFRVSPGGAQGRYGIVPDLTTMAKILAGGLPGGAVGGRADVMDMLSYKSEPDWNARKRISHPGTFNGNPLSAAAGSACLELVASQPINQRADTAAERLRKGMRDVLSRLEVLAHVHGPASIVNVAFGVQCDCPGEFCTASHEMLHKAMKPQVMQGFKRAMLNAGVDTMGGRGFLVSATHQDKDVDQTVGAFERAVTAMRKDGLV